MAPDTTPPGSLEYDCIRFNAIKHHCGYIRTTIRAFSLQRLRSALPSVGHSLLDLYTGDLDSMEIMKAIQDHILDTIGAGKESYRRWLKDGAGYRSMVLPDKSVWILREGLNANHFVHIHPGRYSPFSIRITANTLKAAIGTAAWIKMTGREVPDLELVNEVRMQWLGLSPLRKIPSGGALARVLSLILN